MDNAVRVDQQDEKIDVIQLVMMNDNKYRSPRTKKNLLSLVIPLQDRFYFDSIFD